MLRRLQVKNYVLIDSLDIEFPEGLVIITGQTGAGKSILLGSIALVLGGKAEAQIIGESADNCVVEAEFEIAPDNVGAKKILEENDVEWDDGHLVLRRVVSRSGRSRAFANDCPVPVQVLVSLATSLIDIHSQHQTLLISDRKFQMSALDHFAGATSLAQKCSEAYREYTDARTALEEMDRTLARIASERDYDEARLERLEAASLHEGELEALEAEQKQLANAEEIKEALCAVENYFCSGQEGSFSVDAVLRESVRRLDRIAQYIPALSPIAERLVSARVELDDILAEVSAINSSVELSKDRLDAVEERMSLLYGLIQKYSCHDLDELIAVRDSLREILHDSSALEERREEMAKELEAKLSNLEKTADLLHEKRLKAAPEFAGAIQASIQSLELQQAVFQVELQPAPLSATGKDAVLFLFSSTGRVPVELSKCASGGEMSRIMLCLKEMMARFTNMPTMIFDEIDTGVSGSVAAKMGSMICKMGDNMQVFAITHLPQVAAKGKAHYLVSRDTLSASGRSVTGIHKLSGQEREMEVARMLSGSQVTPEAIANAKSLLSE